MALHRTVSSHTVHPLRTAGLVSAYALALITGTAVLMAAIGSIGGSDFAAIPSGQVTAAEIVMQQAAEQGVRPLATVMLTASNETNDRRGF